MNEQELRNFITEGNEILRKHSEASFKKMDPLGRLTEFYFGMRGPYDGIARDIGIALDEIRRLRAQISAESIK